MQEDFARNLQLLCSYYPSVAAVCRRLSIHRGQFNKYLAGNCIPARSTLRRICDFFGVESHEILLPHPQFAQIIQVRPSRDDSANATLKRPYLAHVEQLQRQSVAPMRKYLGYYFEYYNSMSFPGNVLRSLLRIECDGEGVYYSRMERLRQVGGSDRGYRCKYLGMAFFLSERIFLVDYEALTRNEITQTVLFPTYRNRLDYLTGLKIGVSSSDRHEPACARVVLESLGQKVSLKKALPLCGLYPLGSPALAPIVRERISNEVSGGPFHFLGMPL